MTETKTEARERMSDETLALYESVPKKTVAGVLVHQRAFDDLLAEARRARASEASLTAALSALRAEHQRTQADLEDLRTRHAAAAPAIERLVADRDELRAQLAEVTKERAHLAAVADEVVQALGFPWPTTDPDSNHSHESFDDVPDAIGLLDEAHDSLDEELTKARAALAASEEKARGMREALELLLAVQNGPPLLKYEREWNAAMDMGQRALSSSAGPASEEPKR